MVEIDILGNHSTDRSEPTTVDAYSEQFETPLPNGLMGINSFLKQLKLYQSGIFRRFFPRAYAKANRYADWRIPSAIAAATLLQVSRGTKELGEMSQAYANVVGWGLQWESYMCPLFFLEPAFLEAMMQTSIPDTFDLSNFALPYTGMTFILPENSPVRFQGKSVRYIGLAQRKGSLRTSLGEIIAPSEDLHKVIVTTGFYPGSFFATGFRYDRLNEIVRMPWGEFQMAADLTDTELTKSDAEFVLGLLKLGINICLAMESRPELIQVEALLSEVNPSHRKAASAAWMPNIIGSRYRIVRSEPGGGSHASPRSHWRRGHFRRQNIAKQICAECGHQKSAHHGDVCMVHDCPPHVYKPVIEYKTIWIEPVLVNALGGAHA